MNLDGLSFCESTYATSVSPWHLRELTSVGQKIGGGIDTGSFCGRVRPQEGWDLVVPVTEDRVTNHAVCCLECARAARYRP